MGMFDWVRVKARCPYCGEVFESSEFQSKDAECELAVIEWNTVDSFYGDCPNKKCGKWLEFSRIDPKDVTGLANLYFSVETDEAYNERRKTP